MTPSIYSWSGGTEAILRFGPDRGPLVIAAIPPFEEANRTRAFIVAILRTLGDGGIAGAMPDLPGAGDSLTATEDATLDNWRSAFSAAADSLRSLQGVHALGVRGGALLDPLADLRSRYHLAPATGTDLVRDMIRIRMAAAKEDGIPLDPGAIDPPGPPIDLAGNLVSRQLLNELRGAVPTSVGKVRTVRLETDPRPADRKIAGTPLWRRAEPANDFALAKVVADDIADWIAACDA